MLLKDFYNNEFLQQISHTISEFDKNFDSENFIKLSSSQSWSEAELKQRMRLISTALNKYLSPQEYLQKVEILKKLAVKIIKGKNYGLTLIIFPDFIEVFGCSNENFDVSMLALEFFTEFGSSEFAVRQFIKLDEIRALYFLKRWSESKNYHVRRLDSECCRPRLPWGESLQVFKRDPAAIIPILEKLKYDESQYVRRSVANNINDISKDNPQVVLDLLAVWKKENIDEKLIKHALRTLLKQGNKASLGLIDIDCNNLSENFTIQTFALKKAVINISDDLEFEFALESKVSSNKIRLEYAISFLKKNGSYSRKIFQITTKNFAKGVVSFTRKHSFRNLSTRKHYLGEHFISLCANGTEFQKLQFDLN